MPKRLRMIPKTPIFPDESFRNPKYIPNPLTVWIKSNMGMVQMVPIPPERVLINIPQKKKRPMDTYWDFPFDHLITSIHIR